jgi:hypothetical protein
MKVTQTLLRHKHIIILSIAIAALAFYIVPIDHIFRAPGVEAKTGGGSDNKYGRNEFGKPPGHGGNNPGEGGGTPPGNTPGGSDTPPGLQDNPSKHESAAKGDNGGGSNTDSVVTHKTTAKPDKGDDNGGGNNVASHKRQANKNTD